MWMLAAEVALVEEVTTNTRVPTVTSAADAVEP